MTGLRVRVYEVCGEHALSVLCDGHGFAGRGFQGLKLFI